MPLEEVDPYDALVGPSSPACVFSGHFPLLYPEAFKLECSYYLVPASKCVRLHTSSLKLCTGWVIRQLAVSCGQPSTPQKLTDVLKQGSLPGESTVKND